MSKTKYAYDNDSFSTMSFKECCNTTERWDARTDEREDYIRFCKNRINEKGFLMGALV